MPRGGRPTSPSPSSSSTSAPSSAAPSQSSGSWTPSSSREATSCARSCRCAQVSAARRTASLRSETCRQRPPHGTQPLLQRLAFLSASSRHLPAARTHAHQIGGARSCILSYVHVIVIVRQCGYLSCEMRYTCIRMHTILKPRNTSIVVTGISICTCHDETFKLVFMFQVGQQEVTWPLFWRQLHVRI